MDGLQAWSRGGKSLRWAISRVGHDQSKGIDV